MPETSNAYSDFSVWQNLEFSGTIYGLSKQQIKSKSLELLKRFKLDEKKNVKTKTLSKGLKQRLNLCMALLHEPSILILDEPMSGLDPFSVSIVRNQILQLQHDGKTILITTHNMQEAQRVCDRILIMNKGKIIADHTPEDLLKKFKPFSKLIFTMADALPEKVIDEFQHEFEVSHELKEGISMLTVLSTHPLRDIIKCNTILEKHEVSVQNFKLQESTLEEVFIHLIKKDSLQGGRTND